MKNNLLWKVRSCLTLAKKREIFLTPCMAFSDANMTRLEYAYGVHILLWSINMKSERLNK